MRFARLGERRRPHGAVAHRDLERARAPEIDCPDDRARWPGRSGRALRTVPAQTRPSPTPIAETLGTKGSSGSPSGMRLCDGAELWVDLHDLSEATGRRPDAPDPRREVDDGRPDPDRLDDRARLRVDPRDRAVSGVAHPDRIRHLPRWPLDVSRPGSTRRRGSSPGRPRPGPEGRSSPRPTRRRGRRGTRW